MAGGRVSSAHHKCLTAVYINRQCAEVTLSQAAGMVHAAGCCQQCLPALSASCLGAAVAWRSSCCHPRYREEGGRRQAWEKGVLSEGFHGGSPVCPGKGRQVHLQAYKAALPCPEAAWELGTVMHIGIWQCVFPSMAARILRPRQEPLQPPQPLRSSSCSSQWAAVHHRPTPGWGSFMGEGIYVSSPRSAMPTAYPPSQTKEAAA